MLRTHTRRFAGMTTAVALGLSLVAAAPVMAGHHEEGDKKVKTDKPDIIDTAMSAGQFNTLAAALRAADLVDTLKAKGPYTVFAPTDAAFAKLPKGAVESLLEPENKDKLRAILLFHVVPGKVSAKDVVKLKSTSTALGQPAKITADDYVTIDGSQVTKTDIWASNGVIHVIDTVMMPHNIVEVASSAGKFDTLLAAAKAAGLAGTLANGGPFTVFAPTDDAFAKLPAGTVENLLKPENKDQLKAILLHHVVSGRVTAADVVKMESASTLNGDSVAIKTWKKEVSVGGAKVIGTDVQALNGVVHIIDQVMLPKAN